MADRHSSVLDRVCAVFQTTIRFTTNPKGPELLFLAFAIGLAQFTSTATKDR
jgi:hypothetical protein